MHFQVFNVSIAVLAVYTENNFFSNYGLLGHAWGIIYSWQINEARDQRHWNTGLVFFAEYCLAQEYLHINSYLTCIFCMQKWRNSTKSLNEGLRSRLLWSYVFLVLTRSLSLPKCWSSNFPSLKELRLFCFSDGVEKHWEFTKKYLRLY